MATYIGLFNFTQQGVENIGESANRLDAARTALGAIGVDLKEIFLTMGQYDLVAIMEADNDATAARGILMIAAQGNVRGETLKAFNEKEYRDVIASLG